MVMSERGAWHISRRETLKPLLKGIKGPELRSLLESSIHSFALEDRGIENFTDVFVMSRGFRIDGKAPHISEEATIYSINLAAKLAGDFSTRLRPHPVDFSQFVTALEEGRVIVPVPQLIEREKKYFLKDLPDVLAVTCLWWKYKSRLGDKRKRERKTDMLFSRQVLDELEDLDVVEGLKEDLGTSVLGSRIGNLRLPSARHVYLEQDDYPLPTSGKDGKPTSREIAKKFVDDLSSKVTPGDIEKMAFVLKGKSPLDAFDASALSATLANIDSTASKKLGEKAAHAKGAIYTGIILHKIREAGLATDHEALQVVAKLKNQDATNREILHLLQAVHRNLLAQEQTKSQAPAPDTPSSRTLSTKAG